LNETKIVREVKIDREVLEIYCWKERNGAESAKATTGAKAASDIDGMKRQLTEKSWRYAAGKRGIEQKAQ
jgi:hypothetical protein